MSEAAQLQTGALGATAPMHRRRRVAELPVNAGFLVAAVALAALGADGVHWPVADALLLCGLFAAAVRVQIVVGLGYTTPVQLAFVPMLLLLPAAWVPLLVLASWIVGRLPDVLRGRVHPDRLLLLPGSCWFAVGAALVLVLADPGPPSWGDWPVYLAALAAQVAFDLGFGLLSERLARGTLDMPPWRSLLLSPAIDALLAPLGLLAVFATQATTFAYAYLLLVPPTVLLAFYARERAGRLQAAVALAEAATERERLIAGASHELNTPLGVMTGLYEWLGPDRTLPPARRDQVYAAMGRELHQLRQLIRQFGDFANLRTDRPLRLEVVPVPACGAVEAAVTALGVPAHVEGDVALRVHADPERLERLLTTLLRAATRGKDVITVTVAAEHTEGVVVVRGLGDATAAQQALGGKASTRASSSTSPAASRRPRTAPSPPSRTRAASG